MRREASQYARLGVNHAGVLVYLGRLRKGQAVRPLEIQRELGISSGAATLTTLAALVQEGLAEVTAKRLYRISPAGQAFVDENSPDPPPPADIVEPGDPPGPRFRVEIQIDGDWHEHTHPEELALERALAGPAVLRHALTGRPVEEAWRAYVDGGLVATSFEHDPVGAVRA